MNTSLTPAEARKPLHIVTTGTMTLVYVFGTVIGTVAEVKNPHRGVHPKTVFQANSRSRGVFQENRNTLNEAVSAVLNR